MTAVVSKPKTVEEIARSLIGAGRPIIKRPRLTRLLDEAETRVIMLVAPAGYGKTTLAHEWLDGRDAPHAWYTCSPASSDVAALAAGIAEAAEAVVPDASERLRTRLRVTNAPESEVDVLAELLAEDLSPWPADAWLCLDDYHYATRSDASERFVERLLSKASLRLLVATRERPAWATPRLVMYGALAEVGMNALAMTHDEASEVLPTDAKGGVPGLLALTNGWPAVIGLAAVMPRLELPAEELPTPLYDYIVQELYETAPAALQLRLSQLAIAPNPTVELLEFMFGADADRTLAEGVRLGFLTPKTDATIELHPLLRAFLTTKLRERGRTLVEPTAERVGRFLVERRQWDDAFAVAAASEHAETMVALIEESLDEMLTAGRLPTLMQWLEAAQLGSHPTLMAAEAEVAFRRGDFRRAEALATSAAAQLADDHRFLSRAYFRAGQCAHFTDRSERAIEFFASARRSALTDGDLRDALWGHLATALDFQRPESPRLLAELLELRTTRVEDRLREATAKLLAAIQTGRIVEVLDDAATAAHLVEKASDPMIRTAYLNTVSSANVMAARFEAGLETAKTALADAERYRLGFLVPHVLANKAACEFGLRQFAIALSTLRRADHMAMKFDDVYTQMNVAALLLRLRICEGAAQPGLAELPPEWKRIPTSGMRAELLACRALAYAILGEYDRATGLATDAAASGSHPDVRVLCRSAIAIGALRRDHPDAPAVIRELVEDVLGSGNRFGLVIAYRGYPDLLPALVHDDRIHETLRATLIASRDLTLASALASVLELPPQTRARRGTLSRREQEVLELLATGMKNREIAQTLYISEVTVKVHVRRILAKLGVRTRTEAALLKRDISLSDES